MFNENIFYEINSNTIEQTVLLNLAQIAAIIINIASYGT